jgi:hypothetical protein
MRATNVERAEQSTSCGFTCEHGRTQVVASPASTVAHKMWRFLLTETIVATNGALTHKLWAKTPLVAKLASVVSRPRSAQRHNQESQTPMKIKRPMKIKPP